MPDEPSDVEQPYEIDSLNPSTIIAKKRDGGALTHGELASVIERYVSGEIADYQMSALAMAIYLRGMDAAETDSLTELMLNSGTTLPRPSQLVRVDKHSTGGIGDKVSLILAPLLACCGLQVPMISGRGLGPTGGTLDKLESIPGFRTDLSIDEITNQTERIGCVITGATTDLVPADRKLYALRDATATVSSIPLITASIMSKKLAEQLDALVLDVKVGSGAFMKSIDDARALATSMVAVGRNMGVTTTALLTDMNQPLGRMAGNAVEVQESIETLAGDGPDDLVELTVRLAAELLISTNREADLAAADKTLKDHLDSGRARERFDDMVRDQGGDPSASLEVAPASEIECEQSGYVRDIDTEALGLAIIEMGGGRKKTTDRIDHSVGIEMLVRIGDAVAIGQPLIRVFAQREMLPRVESQLRDAVGVGTESVARRLLVIDRISG